MPAPSYDVGVHAAEESFPPSPASVGAARRFASSVLRSWGMDEVEDDLRLVVTELATNAVLHARTDFTVSVALDGGRVRVGVTDGVSTRPRAPRHPGHGHTDHEATTGRGMAMIAALSASWGVDPAGAGKTTWCELSGPAGGGGSFAEGAQDWASVAALHPLPGVPSPYAGPAGLQGSLRAAVAA